MRVSCRVLSWLRGVVKGCLRVMGGRSDVGVYPNPDKPEIRISKSENIVPPLSAIQLLSH